MKAQGHRSSGACDKANMGPEDTCDSGGILEGKIPKRRAVPKRTTNESRVLTASSPGRSPTDFPSFKPSFKGL